MNESYKNMREFWLDVKNLENKAGVQGIGKDAICIAGCEFALKDNADILKNIFIAGSVLGDASLYFENNSPAGIGGMLGGGQKAKDIALKMINEAALLTADLQQAPTLAIPEEEDKVTLFAISKEKLFYITIPSDFARDPHNKFYKFYAYSQQLISAFSEAQAEQKK